MTSPYSTCAAELRPLLADGGCIKGTPMIPLHRNTVARIVELMDAAHKGDMHD